MVGEFAHDLNNMLAIILGHTELAIEEAGQNGASARRLGDIREAVNNAASLCRGMLAYAGRTKAESGPVDLARLVTQWHHLLRITVPRNSRLECHIDPGLPLMQGDPSQLRQILMNLVLNAVEALGSQAGCIRLHVGMAAAAVAGVSGTTAVAIRVVDNGCGMDARALDNLFLPFYSTKASGRGLGLTAVLTLVEAMEGVVRVESEPGQGTTFTVYFPSLLNADSVAPGSEIQPPEMDVPGDGALSGTVLFADDEPELRMLGSAMLTRAGLKVFTVNDGLEAVECFRQNAPSIDLVILDAVMPRMDGCRALAGIKEIDPGVRVIMITGQSETDLGRQWNGARPDHILLKPVSARELRRVALHHLALGKAGGVGAPASQSV